MEAMMKRDGNAGQGAWARRILMLPPMRMLMLMLKLTLMLPLLLLIPTPLYGQGPTPPDFVAYQGTLVNGDGEPLGKSEPRNYDVVFRVFDASSGGTLIWSEQQTVTVDGGRYSIQLGRGGPFGTEPRPALASVFRSSTASDRFLEATVNGVGPGRADFTTAPRVRMVPGAYALVSRHAMVADRLVNSGSANVISIVETRVGINVTNPAAALQVAGTAKASGAIRVGGNADVRGVATARNWTGRGAAPVGSVILWSGTVVDKPQGWALCDGTVVNGFRTPDLRGRFVLGAGAGAGLTDRAVGQTGGAERHVLTEAELPAHAHSIPSATGGTDTRWGHQHSFLGEAHRNWDEWSPMRHPAGFLATGNEVSADVRSNISTTGNSGHQHALDLPPTPSSGVGGGAPLDNMPPYYVLAYLVRVP